MTPAAIKKISRVALFSALVYLFSWATAYIPNVNLLFFIVFLSGYLWGFSAGMTVGIVGNGLWSFFNPFGPAMIPILFSQMVGAALVGVMGGLVRKYEMHTRSYWMQVIWLVPVGAIATILYFIPVNSMDAFLAQPFWERFVAGAVFSLISVISNLFIFPLLFVLLTPFINRETETA